MLLVHPIPKQIWNISADGIFWENRLFLPERNRFGEDRLFFYFCKTLIEKDGGIGPDDVLATIQTPL